MVTVVTVSIRFLAAMHLMTAEYHFCCALLYGQWCVAAVDRIRVLLSLFSALIKHLCVGNFFRRNPIIMSSTFVSVSVTKSAYVLFVKTSFFFANASRISWQKNNIHYTVASHHHFTYSRKIH